MPLAPEFVESVADVNLKNVGDAPAFYSALAMGNSVSHQQAMNSVTLAATGSIVKALTEMDIAQASSIVKAATGQDVAGTITALLSALQSGQIGTKVAQTTPPPTA